MPENFGGIKRHRAVNKNIDSRQFTLVKKLVERVNNFLCSPYAERRNN
jgi:hypothetical protein